MCLHDCLLHKAALYWVVHARTLHALHACLTACRAAPAAPQFVGSWDGVLAQHVDAEPAYCSDEAVDPTRACITSTLPNAAPDKVRCAEEVDALCGLPT